MKKLIISMSIGLTLTACHQTSDRSQATSTSTNTTTTMAKDDSLAAQAGEAGLRARKKAEALQAAENAKTKQTNEEGNQ